MGYEHRKIKSNYDVYFNLKGFACHTNIGDSQENILRIQITSASNEHVDGRTRVNISYGPRVTATPGLKGLAPVENISGSRGVGCR